MKTPTNKSYLTGDQSEMFWHYNVPSHVGQKVQLLTVGGVATTGQWTGELGQTFVAWAPLLKVDHEQVARVMFEHRFRVAAKMSAALTDLIASSDDEAPYSSEARILKSMYTARLRAAARRPTDLIRPGSIMRLRVHPFKSYTDRILLERVITNPHDPMFSTETMLAQFVFSERVGVWLMLHPEDWPTTMSKMAGDACQAS